MLAQAQSISPRDTVGFVLWVVYTYLQAIPTGSGFKKNYCYLPTKEPIQSTLIFPFRTVTHEDPCNQITQFIGDGRYTETSGRIHSYSGNTIHESPTS